MQPLPIHRFPDPCLKHAARPVHRVDEEIRRFIEALIKTMRHHPRCVGLAAPQVGRDLRIAVMDASAHPKATASHGLLVLVNPSLHPGEASLVQREGCLSLPDFTANVRRATRVRLNAWDRFGVPYECWLEGFEAIVAQHEVDHLDGALFLDRVSSLTTDVFRRKRYGERP
jgi:peptide deformylase